MAGFSALPLFKQLALLLFCLLCLLDVALLVRLRMHRKPLYGPLFNTSTRLSFGAIAALKALLYLFVFWMFFQTPVDRIEPVLLTVVLLAAMVNLFIRMRTGVNGEKQKNQK